MCRGTVSKIKFNVSKIRFVQHAHWVGGAYRRTCRLSGSLSVTVGELALDHQNLISTVRCGDWKRVFDWFGGDWKRVPLGADLVSTGAVSSASI